MAKNLTDLGCKSTIYLTPDKILDPVKKFFGGTIHLDPATEPSNPTDASYFGTACKTGGIKDLGNGLIIDWNLFDSVFVNPPYGKVIKHWCEKIHIEAAQGAKIIALLPAGARFSTKYFQDHVFIDQLNTACFIRGRVKFLRPDRTVAGSNPYDSVLYGFNCDKALFSKEFSSLGKVLGIDVL